ncbi:type IV pilus modification PilV family protein [Pseudazoarcus pumilus]|uniref:General secretion pathway protein GspI n=1 Tax=Pseudazoarcus pumilus TaxID=2067960 RepID=A0A2I6S926_9RHOO|nr:type II secretion system protein [Pseudazoarcus pumilus]AUN95757.1 general secretion pathway protein GspI [Pseudazoarcus pumilus]
MSAARGQRGFSLIEVVVAFAILALSLGALYQSAGGSVRGMQEVERRSAAVLLARSLLELHDTVPEGGFVRDGRSESGGYWRISATRDLSAAGDDMWPLYHVEVEVWDADARAAPVFRVATLRPEREPDELEGR